MPCRLGRLLDVSRRQSRCSELVRISQLPGFLAGQRDNLCAGIFCNIRLRARPRAVIERRHHARSHRTIKASLHGLMCHADRLIDGVGFTGWHDRPAGSVPVEPDRPIPFPTAQSPPARSSQPLQTRSLLPSEVAPSYSPTCFWSQQITACTAHSGIGHYWPVPRNRCTSSVRLRTPSPWLAGP